MTQPQDIKSPADGQSRLTDVLCVEAMKLYSPPFRYDRGYIWDAQNNMVADDDAQDVALRIRGWGRISYMPDAEALQDKVGELIAQAMTEFWVTHIVKLRGCGDGTDK